jgi:hypothetical protein
VLKKFNSFEAAYLAVGVSSGGINGIYQRSNDAVTEVELRICGVPSGATMTTLKTKLYDNKNSKSAAEITMDFYKNDFKTQTQRFKLWTVDNKEIITTEFPAGDWNRVVIKTDSTDELAFKVFQVYYG